jgi:hypothetical protein
MRLLMSQSLRVTFFNESSGRGQMRNIIEKYFPNLCNPKMIMSYYANLEMSYCKVAIVPLFGGGCNDQKGHSYDESGRIKAVTRYA